MGTSSPQSRRLRDCTSIPFEIFIVTFTVLPFIVLAYFYPALSERVPLFLNLRGEVETWTDKSVLSVFRVPLIAVVMQVVCRLMKYGVVESQPAHINADRTKLFERYVRLNTGLWDWFRSTIALKMIAESLDTMFLSIERFNFLSRPAFITSAVATAIGVVGALVYVYRLLAVRREMKREFVDARAVDVRHVYGGILYFNRSDSALFAGKHVFNFGNKWAWVFIACFIAYPLLAFWPA